MKVEVWRTGQTDWEMKFAHVYWPVRHPHFVMEVDDLDWKFLLRFKTVLQAGPHSYHNNTDQHCAMFDWSEVKEFFE